MLFSIVAICLNFNMIYISLCIVELRMTREKNKNINMAMGMLLVFHDDILTQMNTSNHIKLVICFIFYFCGTFNFPSSVHSKICLDANWDL